MQQIAAYCEAQWGRHLAAARWKARLAERIHRAGACRGYEKSWESTYDDVRVRPICAVTVDSISGRQILQSLSAQNVVKNSSQEQIDLASASLSSFCHALLHPSPHRLGSKSSDLGVSTYTVANTVCITPLNFSVI